MRKRSKGAGTILKKGDKYLVRVTTDIKEGKQIQKQLGTFTSFQEAETELAKYNESKPVIDRITTKDHTIKFFADKIITEKEKTLPKKSYTDYFLRPYKLLKPIYDMRIIDINYLILEGLINNIDNYYNKVYTKALLQNIYKLAHKYDINILNYPDLLDVGKRPAKKINRQVLSCEDVQKLWKSEGQLQIDMILFLLYTGCRVEEMLQIQNENVKLDEGYIIGGLKTDAGKNRVIPIHKDIIPIVKRYYNKDKKYLFENRENKPYSYSFLHYNCLEIVKEIIGKEINLHDTRHTFTSRMSELGVDLYVIKRIIGHKIKDMTEGIYIHQSPEQLLEAINKLYY